MENKQMNLCKTATIVLSVLLQVMTSAVFAQKKESYTGTMTLPDDIPVIVLKHTGDYTPGETNGDATYEYYLNPQGDRVKDGKFDFTCVGYTGGIYKYIIEGDYKDGKKNGFWTFTNGGGIMLNNKGHLVESPAYNTKYAIFKYVDDVRTGDFLCTVCCDECYVDIAGQVENDHMVGKSVFNFRSYYRPENVFLILEAYFDKDGNPEKEWTFESTTGKRMKHYLKYENGTLVKVEQYDESTGQKKVLVDAKADASQNEYLTDFSLDDYVLEQVDGIDFYLSKNEVPYKKEKKTVEYRLTCKDFNDSYLRRIVKVFKNLSFNVIDKECEVLVPSEKEYLGCKVDAVASSVVADYNALVSKIEPLQKSEQMYYVPAGKKHDLFNDADVIVRDYLGIMEDYRHFYSFSRKLDDYLGVYGGGNRLKFNAHTYQNNHYLDVAAMKEWMATWTNAKAELAGLSEEADKQIEARAKMDEVTQNMIRVDANMSGKQKKYFTKLVERRDAVGIIEFFENPEIATQK
ncbi:MAG: hypothetical protein MJ000_05320 [Bacteroidales bacterium]|nr:hypothetical protein [Bacteroidales bacterium]